MNVLYVGTPTANLFFFVLLKFWQNWHDFQLGTFFSLQVEMEGLTGKIRFDTLGFRSDFHLDIVELKKEGLVKVGTWNHGAGVNFTRNYTESYSEIVESLHNKTLKITTILVSISPFFSSHFPFFS